MSSPQEVGRITVSCRKWAAWQTVLAGLVFGLLFMPPAEAIDSMPAFSGEWVNCEPFDAEDLKGKMMVLLFFDEAAPEYKTLWAELAKIKQTHEMPDHVLFFAINSGSPKMQIMAYCRTYGVSWKLLADETRAFEKQFGIRVDKTNFEKVFFVDPNGQVKPLDTTKLDKAVKDAVDSNKARVKWKLDPKEVPGTATPMWTSYEFGAWKPLCGSVATNLRSREPKLRQCAVTIDAALKEIIKTKADKAKVLLDAGDKWGAYKAYRSLVASFPERSETAAAYRELTRLANEGSVDFQVKAKLALEQTENSTRDIVTQPGAKAWYDAIVKNYPKTEAAEIAQALIDDAYLSAGVPKPPMPGATATGTATVGGAAGTPNGASIKATNEK